MAWFVRDGDSPVEIVGRSRIDRSAARRMMIKEMIIMKGQGYTYREIGLVYRLSHTRVRSLILDTPPHVCQRLQEIGLV